MHAHFKNVRWTHYRIGGVLIFLLSISAVADAEIRAGRLGIRAGTERYVTGRWGTLAFDIVNPDATDAEALVVGHFGSDPNLQYGRRVWVPAHSQRASSHLMLSPTMVPKPGPRQIKGTSIPLRLLLYDVTNGGQHLVRKEHEQVLREETIMIDWPSPNTGLLANANDDAFYEGVVASRGSMRLTRRLSLFGRSRLPVTPEAWEGLDQCILANDTIADNMLAVAAVRQWVERGGKLWLPLDRIREETVLLLLGDAYQGREIGRIDLTEVAFQSDTDGSGDIDGPPRTYETPVPLVRVVTENAEVVHTINGWPASFWISLGEGEILVTTLGIRGWIRPHTPNDPPPVDPSQGTDFVTLSPLSFLAGRFFSKPIQTGLTQESYQAYLAPQLGYQVPPRRMVTGIFAVYCGAILLVGGFLYSLDRLQHFLWLTPAFSAAAVAVLVSLGAGSKSTPATVGSLQFLQVAEGGNDGQITGAALLYSPSRSKETLGAEQGGIFLPNMEKISSAKRMVWTDYDQWHWENLTLPAGARNADYRIGAHFSEPLIADVAFGPEGLVGEVRGSGAAQFSDALLAAPILGNMGVRWQGNRFTAAADDVLVKEQFFLDAFLSDEQRRRQGIYRQLLQPTRSKRAYPATPTLLAWRDPLETHFQLPRNARRFGAALVAIPLSFRQTPPGQMVVIASPFLPFRTVGKTNRDAGASTYDHRKDEWLAKQYQATTILRVQIPKSVLPLEILQADVTLKIRAPSREMVVYGGSPEQPVAIGRELNPVGAFRYRLTEPEQLYVDSSGGFFLQFTVGDLLTPAGETGDVTNNPWKVESLRLQLRGRTGKTP